ncbi:cytochrome P450 1A1-like [Mercenaria mercenaria]|uniref:cytochrome P450 1A1-like n=1 Tax=Mercenaria mercenaria TaxID=6596 RepID=UPI00234F4B6D|nr:cytochrome P450 1A1-like [Mercenaria mercenaria]
MYFGGKKNRQLKGKVIKGPKGLPFLGNILEINERNMLYKFMDYALQFGSIFRVNMLIHDVVVLNNEELIRKAFGGEKHKTSFNDRMEMFYAQKFRNPDMSVPFVRNGASRHYKVTRKMFTQTLHAYGSGLKELEKNVMKEIESLIQRVNDTPGKEFECVALFQRSLSNVISLLLTGDTVPNSDQDYQLFWEYINSSDIFLNPRTNFTMITFPFLRFLPGWYRDKFQEAKRALEKIVQKYFYDYKKTYVPGEERGIVDHYLEAQRKETELGNKFPDDMIIAAVVDTIHAGTTTTLSALSNTMLVLLNNPQYQTKLQQEFDNVIGRERAPTYSDREKCTFFKAFEMEILRYIPVAPLLLPHVCRDQVELEGFGIAEGTVVFGNVWFVHHNKEIWGDPWTFRPERFLDEHGNLLSIEHKLRRNLLAFGYGLRHCPGEVFARTRYFLYISSLLQRWSFEFLEGKGRPCDPRLSENFVIKEIMRALPFRCRVRERR